MLCGISLDIHGPKIIFSIRFIFPSTLSRNYSFFSVKKISVLLEVPISLNVKNGQSSKASDSSILS